MKITQKLFNRVTKCNEIWGSTNRLLPEYYMTSLEIKSILKCLDGEKIKYKSIGRTARGQEIPSVFIGDSQSTKPIVVIEAGSHGREKIASAATLYVIKELARKDKSLQNEILETADFAIVPLLNPDGYQYAITTDENWRKNRNDTKIDHCLGVDVNRNYAHRWGEGGIERDPCSSYYCGEEPFSEEESKALRDLVLGLLPRCQMFLSIRSPFQSISYPWTYDRAPLENSEELELLAWKAADTIRKKFYTEFDVGQSAFLHGSSSGTSIDWARGVANIKYCFSISLPGPQFGFNMPPEAIKRFGQELLEMIGVFTSAFKTKIVDENLKEKIGRRTNVPVPEPAEKGKSD